MCDVFFLKRDERQEKRIKSKRQQTESTQRDRGVSPQLRAEAMDGSGRTSAQEAQPTTEAAVLATERGGGESSPPVVLFSLMYSMQ
jgi:hypothetical protein